MELYLTVQENLIILMIKIKWGARLSYWIKLFLISLDYTGMYWILFDYWITLKRNLNSIWRWIILDWIRPLAPYICQLGDRSKNNQTNGKTQKNQTMIYKMARILIFWRRRKRKVSNVREESWDLETQSGLLYLFLITPLISALCRALKSPNSGDWY